jgi:hypothetical protein
VGADQHYGHVTVDQHATDPVEAFRALLCVVGDIVAGDQIAEVLDEPITEPSRAMPSVLGSITQKYLQTAATHLDSLGTCPGDTEGQRTNGTCR